MNADDEGRYVEYVSSRPAWLRKVAFLLCQDWHRADDVDHPAFRSLTCMNARLTEHDTPWCRWSCRRHYRR